MGDAVARVASLLAAAGGSCSRGCTTQDKLHWWGKGLGDDECVALAERLQEPGRPRLKNLLLGSNGVGDRCMRALSDAARNGALSSLYALGLSRNRITDAGCEALTLALTETLTLTLAQALTLTLTRRWRARCARGTCRSSRTSTSAGTVWATAAPPRSHRSCACPV